MTSHANPTTSPPNPSAACLRRTVASAMESEPALEAVRIDRERHAIAVATLGQPRNPAVATDLTARIEALNASGGASECGLLDGRDTCGTCPEAESARAGLRMEIRQDGGLTTLARVTCPTAPRFWRWRELPLPRLVPREVTFSDEEDYETEWRHQLVAAALCGGLALTAWFLGDAPLALPLFLAAYGCGAWFAVQEIVERLRARVLDIHFLMVAVAAGSAAIGAWAEGAALLFLFSFSGALEHYALGRTQREIRSLFRSAPKVAHRLDEAGHEVLTPVEALQPGMRLLIRPGEQFPVDAEVQSGRTASDESTLTGESVPVEKSVGDKVLAGTLNLWGSVEAVVLQPASESALRKIIRLIQEAQRLKAPSQRFTDRFGTGYTYAILGLCLVMFFVWWGGLDLPAFRSQPGTPSAFYRAMTLLVVASPCALVLSIPSAVLATIAGAARRGILFRGGAAVEELAAVDTVALDKTGTLTTGELQVDRVESHPPGREDEVARLAVALERLSQHPLARALTRHGKQRGLPAATVTQFESVTGLGLQGLVEGRRVRLGKRDWLGSDLDGWPDPDPSGASPGHSEIWLSTEGLTGRVLLRDDLRPQAAGLIRALQRERLQVIVLTGDRPAAAEALRRQIPLDDIRSGLKPEDKVAAIQSLTRSGRRVAMVGDGVNDAPSLAAAHVGVAMGARGSDAALEQAALVLMHDRLENFLGAYRLSQRARQVIRQNLALSLGTVGVLVAFALFSHLPLTLGVVGHEGSTVVVVLNSLRLLLRPPDQE